MRRTSKNPYNGLWGYTVAAPETSKSNVSRRLSNFSNFFSPCFFYFKKNGDYFLFNNLLKNRDIIRFVA